MQNAFARVKLVGPGHEGCFNVMTPERVAGRYCLRYVGPPTSEEP